MWKDVATFDEYLETYFEDNIEVGIVLGHLTEWAFFFWKAPHLQDTHQHVCTGVEEDKRVDKRGDDRVTRLR
jgi:hypothetical protein